MEDEEKTKLYIESYLNKIIRLVVNAVITHDKLKNVVYTNKEKTVSKIEEILHEASENLKMPQEDIINCLVDMHNVNLGNNELRKESMEIIALLDEIKNKEEKKQDRDIEDNEKAN